MKATKEITIEITVAFNGDCCDWLHCPQLDDEAYCKIFNKEWSGPDGRSANRRHPKCIKLFGFGE